METLREQDRTGRSRSEAERDDAPRRRRDPRTEAGRALATVQSAVFVATGLWPVVHMASFEAVTGRKRERWLVQTMGVLIASVGAALAIGARRGVRSETVALGVGSAAALGACDIVFVARRRISPVYLVDAVMEATFVVAWLVMRRLAR